VTGRDKKYPSHAARPQISTDSSLSTATRPNHRVARAANRLLRMVEDAAFIVGVVEFGAIWRHTAANP